MFKTALDHWGEDSFAKHFRAAIRALELDQLPLKECCNYSAMIDKDSIDVMILSSSANEKTIKLKIGVFFCEVLSGCACSDDPSQAQMLENSYCELLAQIDRSSAKIKFSYASYAS
ncbi:hypothetical protein [Candidatus Thioglobus sp.]|uniref:hypothetical protein n=1 Tax=Candidatus Thioglobus sp. TaxID=2026721 RepID=UPI003D0AEDBB